MNTESNYQTDDISLAAFLLTQEISLIDIHEDAPRHFIFVLSELDKCLQLKSKYLNGAAASAWQLFSQREKLIAEMRGKQRNGGKYGVNR